MTAGHALSRCPEQLCRQYPNLHGPPCLGPWALAKTAWSSRGPTDPHSPVRDAGNGRSKPVCVKNLAPADIVEHVNWLRNSHGRGQEYQVGRAGTRAVATLLVLHTRLLIKHHGTSLAWCLCCTRNVRFGFSSCKFRVTAETTARNIP